MSLKSQLSADALSVFLNINEFGETIVYTPKGESGKSISAIIDREPQQTSKQDKNRSSRKQCELFIANDSTYGVVSITKGVDKVSFSEILGGATQDWLVLDVIDHDGGMWHLLVGQ